MYSVRIGLIYMTAAQLKIIAIICMIIDHIGVFIFKDVIIFRYIGRIAFILFAFTVSESCRHTGSMEKYILRLLMLALISEIPYDLVHGYPINPFYKVNTVYTLMFAALAVYIFKKTAGKRLYILMPLAAVPCVLAGIMKSDYGHWGAAYIFILYLCKNKKQLITASVIMICLHFYQSLYLALKGHINRGTPLILWSILALVFIWLYNGEAGKGCKHLFYAVYPLHFAVFYFLLHISTAINWQC